MAMRVSELLGGARLDLRVVVDGDLERVIRWVHTTELADPTRYLQGGEVILTTGVWRDAGTTSTGFVAPLERSDVAALGYGLPQPDAVMPPDSDRGLRGGAAAALRGPVRRAVHRRLAGIRRPRVRPARGGAARAVLRNDRLVHAAGHGAGLDGILDVLDTRLQPWMLGRGRHVIAGAAGAGDVACVCADRTALPSRSRWRPTAGWPSRSSPSAAPRPTWSCRPASRPGRRRPGGGRPGAPVPRPGAGAAAGAARERAPPGRGARRPDHGRAGAGAATAARLATFGLDADRRRSRPSCASVRTATSASTGSRARWRTPTSRPWPR